MEGHSKTGGHMYQLLSNHVIGCNEGELMYLNLRIQHIYIYVNIRNIYMPPFPAGPSHYISYTDILCYYIVLNPGPSLRLRSSRGNQASGQAHVAKLLCLLMRHSTPPCMEMLTKSNQPLHHYTFLS